MPNRSMKHAWWLVAVAVLACDVRMTGTPPPAGGVTVSIAPLTAVVTPGGAVNYSATVSGTSNGAVTWSVQEAATGGSIDANGHYVAPATLGTYHVRATSVGDTTASATAQVTVSNVPQTDVIPTNRRTLWQPGIPGGIPARTTICATVTPAYASSHGLTAFGTDGTGNASPAIQYAMNNCPAGQVVSLPGGTYHLNDGLSFSAKNGGDGSGGISLRGAGA